MMKDVLTVTPNGLSRKADNRCLWGDGMKKSFDEVIQYISDYVESILVAERCHTKDEFRYIFDIIDKLENDDGIKFFKEKSSMFRHFSEYVDKSDESSEEYVNSDTIQDRYAMYCAARFVDEMIICCQKDFYSRFLTRIPISRLTK